MRRAAQQCVASEHDVNDPGEVREGQLKTVNALAFVGDGVRADAIGGPYAYLLHYFFILTGHHRDNRSKSDDS